MSAYDPSPARSAAAVRTTTGDAVLIAYNRRAGAHDAQRKIERFQRACEAKSLQICRETELPRIVSRAQELAAAGRLRCVVAAGGDGTARLIAENLPADTPLAVLPIGTENLFAKHLGYTTDAETMADLIVAGQTVAIDAATANGQMFLVLASCGFDAAVVRRLHATRTGNISRCSYLSPLWQTIREYDYPALRVTCSGTTHEGRWAFVFNVPQYALQLPIVAEATCLDGVLDVCTFRQGKWWNGVLYFLGILFRRHRFWKDTTVRRTERVRIEADGEVPYQIDGDPGGVLPLEICSLPGRLRVLVGDRWLARYQLASPRTS